MVLTYVDNPNLITLFLQTKKVAQLNRLSCSLTDYDVNGDGSVKVSEFLTTIPANQVGEELSSLIDKDSEYQPVLQCFILV